MQNTTVTSDLQQFILKFEPSKFKLMSFGIEIRGLNDLPKSLSRANSIIKEMGLNLKVNHNADMLSYRGFEVKVI